jgi:hypothetical protein
MSNQTTETKKPFANPEGSNAKQKEIARLRNVALDEQESPTERLAASKRLLSRYGPSKRNVVVINSVVKRYIEGHEYSVVERAQKLKAKLKKAVELKGIVDTDLPEESVSVPAAPTPEIVAGTSAREVPKASLSISLNEVVTAHQEVLGGYKWRIFNEGAVDLTQEERLRLLEAVLGSAPNVENVQSLFDAVYIKNGLGFTIAGSCPSIVRVAQDFLKQKGVTIEPPQTNAETQRLLDALNNRSGVSQ